MDWLFTKTPLVFFTQNLWRDEAFSYLMAAQSIQEIIKTTAADFNPPLYYIVLHYWMLLFGSSEVGLRSLSVIFFAGTLFVLYEIMTRIFRIPTIRSVIYLVFIAANPFLLSYAFEARMYLMVTFFVTLSYYAFWTKNKWLYVISMVLAIYTHYFAVFVVGAQYLERLGQMFLDWKELRISKSQPVRVNKLFDWLLHAHIEFLIVTACFLPWACYLILTHDFGSDGFWIIRPQLRELLFLPFVLFTGYERVFGQYYHDAAGYTTFHIRMNILLSIILFLPIFSLCVQQFIKQSDKIRNIIHLTTKSLPSVLLWALFPPVIILLLSLVATPVYHPRYFIFAVPGLLLILVIAAELIVRLFMSSSRNRAITIFTVFAIGCGMSLVSYVSTFNNLNLKYRSKLEIASMYADIMALKDADDMILLTRDLDYPLARYYTKSPDVRIYNKSYADIPSYIGKVLIPQDAVTFELPRYPSKAFVIFYDSYQIRSQE